MPEGAFPKEVGKPAQNNDSVKDLQEPPHQGPRDGAGTKRFGDLLLFLASPWEPRCLPSVPLTSSLPLLSSPGTEDASIPGSLKGFAEGLRQLPSVGEVSTFSINNPFLAPNSDVLNFGLGRIGHVNLEPSGMLVAQL